ncbi:MAG: SRPBCC domain-containing protein [Candidatus Doudnabacteria bacterium]
MAPIKEVAFERTYDAPVEQVWQAWTKPEMLKQWWGPDNVVIPECEVDLRVGGRFFIVMEAGEGMGEYKGTKWPMEAEFTVVEPKSKLSYNGKAWVGEVQNEETEIDQTTELTLTEENGKTKIKLKATINKSGPNAQMAVEGMKYGFDQQLNKLNNFLAKHK